MTMYSDEHNLLSLAEICEKLEEYGYDVSKRTLLADIKAINETPIKLISVNKPKKGYYLAKSYSQAAINLILEAVFSSAVICENDMDYIKKYLCRNTCLPTLDLILNTTQNFQPALPKKETSADVLYNLRTAIRDKKQVSLSISRIVPGDSFSSAEKIEKIICNPISVAVLHGRHNLVFTRANTPKKVEFINVTRIKAATIINEPASEFSGKATDATNFFNGKHLGADLCTTDWLLIKFRNADIELIDSYFASPVQFRKSKDEDFCVAKVFTAIDSALIGWLFLLGDRVEILKPESLKELMMKKSQNI